MEKEVVVDRADVCGAGFNEDAIGEEQGKCNDANGKSSFLCATSHFFKWSVRPSILTKSWGS